jgi:hypothetical protein
MPSARPRSFGIALTLTWNNRKMENADAGHAAARAAKKKIAGSNLFGGPRVTGFLLLRVLFVRLGFGLGLRLVLSLFGGLRMFGATFMMHRERRYREQAEQHSDQKFFHYFSPVV